VLCVLFQNAYGVDTWFSTFKVVPLGDTAVARHAETDHTCELGGNLWSFFSAVRATLLIPLAIRHYQSAGAAGSELLLLMSIWHLIVGLLQFCEIIIVVGLLLSEVHFFI